MCTRHVASNLTFPRGATQHEQHWRSLLDPLETCESCVTCTRCQRTICPERHTEWSPEEYKWIEGEPYCEECADAVIKEHANDIAEHVARLKVTGRPAQFDRSCRYAPTPEEYKLGDRGKATWSTPSPRTTGTRAPTTTRWSVIPTATMLSTAPSTSLFANAFRSWSMRLTTGWTTASRTTSRRGLRSAVLAVGVSEGGWLGPPYLPRRQGADGPRRHLRLEQTAAPSSPRPRRGSSPRCTTGCRSCSTPTRSPSSD